LVALEVSDTAALRLTRLSFSLGNATLLQVLDTQRSFQQARLGLTRAQAQRYLDTAQLFASWGTMVWSGPTVVRPW